MQENSKLFEIIEKLKSLELLSIINLNGKMVETSNLFAFCYPNVKYLKLDGLFFTKCNFSKAISEAFSNLECLELWDVYCISDEDLNLAFENLKKLKSIRLMFYQELRYNFLNRVPHEILPNLEFIEIFFPIRDGDVSNNYKIF